MYLFFQKISWNSAPKIKILHLKSSDSRGLGAKPGWLICLYIFSILRKIMRKIYVIAFVAFLLLLAGCTSQQQSAGTTAQQQQASQNQSAPQPAATSNCTSPFDGTWKGTIADSGTLTTTVENGSDCVNTWDGHCITLGETPFTASYNFEMTILCSGKVESYGRMMQEFTITRVKASHPLFNCTDGCTTPTFRSGEVLIDDNGTGYMLIGFPNGATIQFADYDGHLQVNPDGKTMTLFIGGRPGADLNSIGSLTDQHGTSYNIETYNNCPQNKGVGGCYPGSIDESTAILTKIS